jgi:hypothetical protein
MEHQSLETFSEAYCRQLPCRPEHFVEKVFLASLRSPFRLVAPVIRYFSPDFFEEDFEAIRELGAVTDRGIFVMDVSFLHGRHQRDKRWLRKSVGVRVSGRKLMRLWNRSFSDNPERLRSRPPWQGSRVTAL